MSNITTAAQPLADMKPVEKFFIGIDSDGCAFDTMEVKHKECFIPNIIKYYHLQPVSKYAPKRSLVLEASKVVPTTPFSLE